MPGRGRLFRICSQCVPRNLHLKITPSPKPQTLNPITSRGKYLSVQLTRNARTRCKVCAAGRYRRSWGTSAFAPRSNTATYSRPSPRSIAAEKRSSLSSAARCVCARARGYECECECECGCVGVWVYSESKRERERGRERGGGQEGGGREIADAREEKTKTTIPSSAAG